MSKFHSTVTRRDFMKGLGLAGAGLGVAAAVSPVFNDLDEVMSSPNSLHYRPWYVKERELFNPTQEVDWNLMKRFNRMNEAHQLRVDTMYRSEADFLAHDARNEEMVAQRKANQSPGWDLKFQALSAAGSGLSNPSWGFTGVTNTKDWKPTAQEMGLPKWSGTPEENSRLLRAALRYFGAALIGYAEVDNTYRNKLFVQNTTTGAGAFVFSAANPDPPISTQQHYVYENVDRPYIKAKTATTPTEYVIPTKPLWLIHVSTLSSLEMVKTNLKDMTSTISKSNSTLDNMHGTIHARLFNFLRTLGDYQAFGTGGHQNSESNFGASAVLTGVAESARQNNWTITPEVGNLHIPYTILTDFPLAPTKPIDAGLWRFCHACKKCATVCPSQSISVEKEPSWEAPLKEIRGVGPRPYVWSNPGVKAFWADMSECHYYYSGMSCGVCYPNCTFAEGKSAMVHDVVRGTVASTGIFNTFLWRASELFGYGNYEDPDVWWDMSLPVLGKDSTVGAGKGDYR